MTGSPPGNNQTARPVAALPSAPPLPSQGEAWALFLDVDGTLLHFAADPEGVESSRGIQALLQRLLTALGGALALISGRRLDNLDRIFDPLVLPAAGLHGLERRDPLGRVHHLGEAEALDHLRQPLAALAQGGSGVALEDKGRALALHYRRAPQRAAELRAAVDALAGPAARELAVLHGKLVSEIKPRHADKGSAIRAFMDEAPYRSRTPVFLGDDVTDEDGFRAVNELGGRSIRVAERSHDGMNRDAGSSTARFRLSDVDHAIAWLGEVAAALEGNDARCKE